MLTKKEEVLIKNRKRIYVSCGLCIVGYLGSIVLIPAIVELSGLVIMLSMTRLIVKLYKIIIKLRT